MPFLDYQLLNAQKIFALCDKIWIDRTFKKQDNSLQYSVREKLVQCNMGLASQNFPIYKKSFNKIGNRQLLHVSNLGTYKGFDVTCRSLVNVEAILHVASSSFQAPVGKVQVDLGNNEKFIFKFLGTINNNDPEINSWIVDNCDFYIHTATMDAQATTILENCARGLIPLITPESGFSSPHAIYLTHDPLENRKIIEWALNLPEEDLLKRSELLREQIVREHNWENIFNKIWDVITEDIESRKIKSQS
jgi:glycosyltransferase involved in cell wall biosynthesis